MEDRVKLTPIKAIRAKCLDCCCNQRAEVRRCQIDDCSLWPYRMGRRPASSATIGHLAGRFGSHGAESE